jgi:hypothetical protein
VVDAIIERVETQTPTITHEVLFDKALHILAWWERRWIRVGPLAERMLKWRVDEFWVQKYVIVGKDAEAYPFDICHEVERQPEMQGTDLPWSSALRVFEKKRREAMRDEAEEEG